MPTATGRFLWDSPAPGRLPHLFCRPRNRGGTVRGTSPAAGLFLRRESDGDRARADPAARRRQPASGFRARRVCRPGLSRAAPRDTPHERASSRPLAPCRWSRPCGPTRGRWPGKRLPRPVGGARDGGRRPALWDHVATPAPQTPPRLAGRQTVPAIARRSGRQGTALGPGGADSTPRGTVRRCSWLPVSWKRPLYLSRVRTRRDASAIFAFLLQVPRTLAGAALLSASFFVRQDVRLLASRILSPAAGLRLPEA